MKQVIFAFLGLWLTTTAAVAELRPYQLEPDRSTVMFTFDLAGKETKGRMPIQTADIALDLTNLSASSANVTMQASKATAGVVFATEAMKGRSVLDTKSFPTLRYRTTGFRGDLNGGVVEGELTIRDVTRPVQMQAQIYRQQGSADGDISRLTVVMTGTVNRHDFGASGFPDVVAPEITFEVVARIALDS